MKLWDIFYWNKHDYRWIWLGNIGGHTKLEAIQVAKAWHVAAVTRGDVLKVVEYDH